MFFLQHILLLLCWIAYVVLHSILASNSVKTRVKKNIKWLFKIYRIFYSCIAFLFLLALLAYQLSIKSFLLFKPHVALVTIALIMASAGLIIMIIAIKKYFPRLSGIKTSPEIVAYKTPLTSGLNAYIRHPLYGGTFIFIWSLFVIFPLLSNFICCTVITVYTLIGIRFEERKLVLQFGDTYMQYKKSTPMLFPKLN